MLDDSAEDSVDGIDTTDEDEEERGTLQRFFVSYTNSSCKSGVFTVSGPSSTSRKPSLVVTSCCMSADAESPLPGSFGSSP